MTELSSEGRAAVRISFPVGLLPPLIARAYGTAFHVAVEAAGGKAVSVELQSIDRVHAQFFCRWA